MAVYDVPPNVYNQLEIRGFGFRSFTSCKLPPARLRNPAASMRQLLNTQGFRLETITGLLRFESPINPLLK